MSSSRRKSRSAAWPPELPETLREEFVGWFRTWDAEILLAELRVSLSGRMTSTLGRAYYRDSRIHLNRRLAAPELRALLAEVLCHEAAHLVVHLRHGTRARPHGREWRETLASVGCRVRVTIPRSECPFMPPVERRGMGLRTGRGTMRRGRGRRGGPVGLREILGWITPLVWRPAARVSACDRRGPRRYRGRS